MIEKGEVIGTEGKLAFVKFKRTSACGNCTACGMAKDEKEVIVDVFNPNGAKKGDTVEVEIETKKAMTSSAIAYIFPLCMLVGGVLTGTALGSAGIINLEKDILGALFGIGFTLAAFLLIRALEPVFKARLKNTYRMVEHKK